MYTNPHAPGRHETITTAALAILFGSGIFLFALQILGHLLTAMLAAGAAVALVGCLHYFVWGRPLARVSDASQLFSQGNGTPQRFPTRRNRMPLDERRWRHG